MTAYTLLKRFLDSYNLKTDYISFKVINTDLIMTVTLFSEDDYLCDVEFKFDRSKDNAFINIVPCRNNKIDEDIIQYSNNYCCDFLFRTELLGIRVDFGELNLPTTSKSRELEVTLLELEQYTENCILNKDLLQQKEDISFRLNVLNTVANFDTVSDIEKFEILSKLSKLCDEKRKSMYLDSETNMTYSKMAVEHLNTKIVQEMLKFFKENNLKLDCTRVDFGRGNGTGRIHIIDTDCIYNMSDLRKLDRKIFDLSDKSFMTIKKIAGYEDTHANGFLTRAMYDKVVKQITDDFISEHCKELKEFILSVVN